MSYIEDGWYTMPTRNPCMLRTLYPENTSIVDAAHIQTNWQYRQYLQTHGPEIQQYNRLAYANESGNITQYPTLQHCCTATSPLHPQPSDLRRSFLAKYDQQSRMVAPSIVLPKS